MHLTDCLISWVFSGKLCLCERYRTCWWLVSIGSSNGLVLSGNKPLFELMLIKICSQNESIEYLIDMTLDLKYILPWFISWHPMELEIYWINSLWPRDAIWRHISGSTLAQAMACCLTAPSHYLSQCWLIISKVLWHSSEDIIIRRFEDISQ